MPLLRRLVRHISPPILRWFAPALPPCQSSAHTQPCAPPCTGKLGATATATTVDVNIGETALAAAISATGADTVVHTCGPFLVTPADRAALSAGQAGSDMTRLCKESFVVKPSPRKDHTNDAAHGHGHGHGPASAGYSVARAAAAVGVNYVDIADNREFVAGFQEALQQAASEARVTAVSGASTVPAVTAAAADALASDFEEVHEIDWSISVGAQAPRGLKTVESVFE